MRQAVTWTRNRKLRVDKTLRLDDADIETIEQHCFVSDAERDLLQSTARPIVLLKKKPEPQTSLKTVGAQTALVRGVNATVTHRLHYLLFTNHQSLFSRSCHDQRKFIRRAHRHDNDEARERLSKLADAFLMHNRGYTYSV